MAAVTLDQVLQMEDTLLTHKFTLEFPTVPGPGTPSDLTVRCQQMVFPGSSINTIETILHGYKRQDFGRKDYTATFSTTFVETKTMPVWRALKGWQEEIRGTRSGSSSTSRSFLAVNPLVTVFDENNAVAGRSLIFGVWPQDVPEVQLDGSGDTQFLVPATFQFDYIEYPGLVTPR